MSTILIAYSTTDGQTKRICLRLKAVIEARGDRVVLADLAEEPGLDPGPFDKVVVGASIRYGRHAGCVGEFVDHNQRALALKPTVFFSVNLVARKPEKRSPETNPYLQKFLRRSAWRPLRTEVFAGRLEYPRYGFADRRMIQLIMWLTGGPTDPRTVAEYTDWARVEALGEAICEL